MANLSTILSDLKTQRAAAQSDIARIDQALAALTGAGRSPGARGKTRGRKRAPVCREEEHAQGYVPGSTPGCVAQDEDVLGYAQEEGEEVVGGAASTTWRLVPEGICTCACESQSDAAPDPATPAPCRCAYPRDQLAVE